MVLNGPNFSFKDILAGFPHGLVLAHFFSDIFAPHDISSKCKMFADDASLFAKIKYFNVSPQNITVTWKK